MVMSDDKPTFPTSRPRMPWRRIYQRRHARYIEVRYERFAHPDGGTPRRLVLVSDVHARDDWFDAQCVQELMRAVREIPHVDAILHLGDFVGDDPTAIDWAAPILASADAAHFAVLGNHDHWADPDRVSEHLEQAGISLLTNTSVRVGDDLVLAGIDSCWGGRPKPRRALEGIDPSERTVVLGHEPYLATLHTHWLHVAGHTHHGQVRSPLLGDAVMERSMPKKSAPYPRGRYSRPAPDGRERHIYTTAGVGYSTVDFRLFCPPEIVVIDL